MAKKLKKDLLKQKSKVYMNLNKFERANSFSLAKKKVYSDIHKSNVKQDESSDPSDSSDDNKNEKKNKVRKNHSQFFTIGNNELQVDQQQQPKESQFKKVQYNLDDDQSESESDELLWDN